MTQLAKTGFFDYAGVIGPVAASLPLVIGTGVLVKKIYDNPKIIDQKCSELKEWVVTSFTPHGSDAARRIAENIFKLLLVLGVCATIIYFSAVLLPIAMAIPIAIQLVFRVGKFCVDYNENVKSIKKYFDSLKMGKFEDRAVWRKRVAKEIVKIVLPLVILGAILTCAGIIVSPLITGGFQWHLSVPFQTKAVVFLEYAAVGLLHLGLAARSWRKGNRAEALFHLFATALSFGFPSFYLSNNDMRLHHSFYGLILMALPSRTAKIFGSFVTFDSILYAVANPRGGFLNGKFVEYDFINTVLEQFKLFLALFSASLIVESISASIKKRVLQISLPP